MPLRRRLMSAVLAFAALGTTLATSVAAAPAPYDESADAKADLARALATAASAKKPVLVIFGANWCGDCRALDAALKAPASAALLAKQFVVLKVDVGNFDRNLDLTAQYGHPTKAGIPAAVVVSPGRQVLYATRAGELSNARRMSETGVLEFFRGVVASAKAKK
ncbi:thioredoxin family protein [Ideonella sp. A 288]|uniref:thioredoxin family protein n=1 Tax=Ideonella sp. A 288 TaxID=1962181 RepID=UPI000B4BD496|nr:thioredoxin family protein [Ideonella sp. A 288]